MSFKIHLLIICLIIAAVSGGWWFVKSRAVPVAAPVVVQDRFIEIIHASWGLNCRSLRLKETGKPQTSGAFASVEKRHPLSEDNVLQAISQLCNGKTQCGSQNIALMVSDPSPTCLNKELEIEYRCFEFDRPWHIRSKNNGFMIDCLQQ